MIFWILEELSPSMKGQALPVLYWFSQMMEVVID